MSLAVRMGWPERHRSVGKWPRIGHMLGHLDAKWIRPTDGGYLEENRALLPLLLESHTLDYIAQTMGPGYSRRLVESRAIRISEQFGLTGQLHHRRLALVGIAAGVRPCVCECENH